MRIRSLFFGLSALALLAACSKTNAPVRLDFVGAAGLLAGSRTVGAGDTLLTQAYAVGNDQTLKAMRIEVTYTPGPAPILYPIPVSSFDPANAPKELTLTYADSLLPANSGGAGKGGEFLFVNNLMARTTSGKETWTYTATDIADQTATRAYRLTVRKTDSAVAVVHSYPLVLRPLPYRAARAAAVRDSRRVFLNLRYGLLLPRYSVLNNSRSLQANQPLIDLVCVATQTGNAVSLAAPADTASRVLLQGSRWPEANRRATEVHAVGISPTQFTAATTNAAIQAAFTASTPYQYPGKGTSNYTTGPLAKDQVVAFKALDANGTTYYGLLQVTAFTGGTNPVLTCQVKVQKY